jgi:hypothetical protein
MCTGVLRLPRLPCHLGHGRGACALGDFLDVASDGCDVWDCGRSNRRRTERCRDDCCGRVGRKRRASAHLDALAHRIAERKKRR